MKMTLITNTKGKLLASMVGHASDTRCLLGDAKHHPRQDAPLAIIEAGPDQLLHEIKVPDKYAKLPPDDLHKKLRKNYCGKRLVGAKKGK
jgi:hypothetical protein